VHLICFHDIILDATTDVANRTEFAKRKRTYEVIYGLRVCLVQLWIPENLIPAVSCRKAAV
jgi:hypothetical protein